MPRFHLNHENPDPRAPRCDFQKVDPCQKSMSQNVSAPVGPPRLKPEQNASIISYCKGKIANLLVRGPAVDEKSILRAPGHHLHVSKRTANTPRGGITLQANHSTSHVQTTFAKVRCFPEVLECTKSIFQRPTVF